MITFLKEKFKGYSIWKLIRLQVESFLITFFSLFPTILGIVLRWCLAKILFLESHGFSWICERVIFVHTDKIKIGKNVGINSNTYINGVGCIDIGDYVLIGNNVTISSGMHPIAGMSPEIFKRPSIPKKITIESDVWIGAGAVIMPGVTLRVGSVIGANSVVTRDTNPYSINVGSPARQIGFR